MLTLAQARKQAASEIHISASRHPVSLPGKLGPTSRRGWAVSVEVQREPGWWDLLTSATPGKARSIVAAWKRARIAALRGA